MSRGLWDFCCVSQHRLDIKRLRVFVCPRWKMVGRYTAQGRQLWAGVCLPSASFLLPLIAACLLASAAASTCHQLWLLPCPFINSSVLTLLLSACQHEPLLTDVQYSLFGRVLPRVPVLPVFKLLVSVLVLAEDHHDHALRQTQTEETRVWMLNVNVSSSFGFGILFSGILGSGVYRENFRS